MQHQSPVFHPSQSVNDLRNEAAFSPVSYADISLGISGCQQDCCILDSNPFDPSVPQDAASCPAGPAWTSPRAWESDALALKPGIESTILQADSHRPSTHSSCLQTFQLEDQRAGCQFDDINSTCNVFCSVLMPPLCDFSSADLSSSLTCQAPLSSHHQQTSSTSGTGPSSSATARSSKLSYGQCIAQNLLNSVPASYADITRSQERLPAAFERSSIACESSGIKLDSANLDSCKPQTQEVGGLSSQYQEDEHEPGMLDRSHIDRWREIIEDGSEEQAHSAVIVVFSRRARTRMRVEVTYQMLASHFHESLEETSSKMAYLLLLC
eukprot:766667-Hanusia_phi.AAC.3